MKKFLLLILALAMMLTVFACAGGDNKKDPGKVPQSSEDEYPVPEKDWGGRDYRIGMIEGYQVEFFTMLDDPNDPIDYALWLRNNTVESLFNVEISPEYTGGTGNHGHVEILEQNILSGDDMYDVTTSYLMSSGRLVMSGCLLDWNQQEYTNLDADYWVSSINDNFEIEGHVYNAAGATNVTTILYCYGVFMNRTLGGELYTDNSRETLIVDEVFDKIRNGEWTIDYFHNVVAGVYEDIDQENGHSAFDQYGFNGETKTNIDIFNFAFDLPMIETQDTDELVEFVYNKTRASLACDKLKDLYWNNTGSLVNGDYIGNFTQGRCLFTTGVLEDCFKFFRDSMEDDYIILPYPKLDEEQSNYYTGTMDNQYVLGLPSSCADPDFASFVTEAMNYEAEKHMVPAYLQESLQGKFATDEVALEMLDYLMEGRRQDFGTLFQDSLDNICVWLRWVVADKGNLYEYIDEREDYLKNFLIPAIVEEYRNSAQ